METVAVQYDRVELEAKTLDELRAILRQEGHASVALQFYTKTQILNLLLAPQEIQDDLLGVSDAPKVVEQLEMQPSSSKPAGRDDTLSDVIARHLQGKITAGVDETQVQNLIEKRFAVFEQGIRDKVNEEGSFFDEQLVELRNEVAELNSNYKKLIETTGKKKTIEVQVVDLSGKIKEMGVQHKRFPMLLKIASLNMTSKTKINVWLVGPAGTGKTTAAEKVAEALGLPFYTNGAIDSEYKLRGFMDAQGRLVSTAFRVAYENGGVYLFDEVDSSLPPALLAFNAALANSHYDFPDKSIPRHPNFICIAAANTYGLGATGEYVGRMKQDAAFIDRFVQLDWPIDENLEVALAQDEKWAKYVQKKRKTAATSGMQLVISPRASIFGSVLLAAGIERDDVVKMTVRKGMTDDQWKRLSPSEEAW